MMLFVYDTTSDEPRDTDATWTHAMRQEDDGEWTSKNGGGYLYKNISDLNGFLDSYYGRFYKDTDKERLQQCFCKPCLSDCDGGGGDGGGDGDGEGEGDGGGGDGGGGGGGDGDGSDGNGGGNERGPFVSGNFGDPHIATFDGLRYDCQAAGEFVMVRSLVSDFEIQQRFTSVGSQVCAQASVSTAIVVREENLPLFQLSLPRGNASSEMPSAISVTGCSIDMIVDRVIQAQPTSTGSPDIVVSVSNRLVAVSFLTTGVVIRLTVRNSVNFGCFFTVQVEIPRNHPFVDSIVGLLGTPNDDPSDDWMSLDGTAYDEPATRRDRTFSPSYDYCTQNWCIDLDDESTSMFYYGPDESFASISACRVPYDPDIEDAVAAASAELLNLCGADNLPCIVEVVCGDLDDVLALLEDEADFSILRDGEPCQDDEDCVSRACGRGSYPGGDKVCCSSGQAISFLVPTIRYCTMQPIGATCRIEDGGNGPLCNSGICVNGFCQDGPQEVGEECDENADCANGPCVVGTCQDGLQEINEPCDEHEDCLVGPCGRIYPSSDLRCCSTEAKLVTGYCSGQLDEGSTCFRNSLCSSGVCAGEICQDGPQAVGELCDENEDCIGGATCVFGLCQEVLAEAGEACGNDDDCASGSCADTFPIGETKICCPSTSLNFFCSNQPEGAGCPSNFHCTSGVCVRNICLAERQEAEETCDSGDNRDCASLICGRSFPDGNYICCSSGTGRAGDGVRYCQQPVNATCDSNSLCISGVCAAGICQAGTQDVGEECDDSDDCGSINVCIDGVCQSGLQGTGEICSESSDCVDGGCGRSSYPSGELICCPLGTLRFISGQGLFCAILPNGNPCTAAVEELCSSGVCGLPMYPFSNPVCCDSTQFIPSTRGLYCNERPSGSACSSEQPQLCASGICTSGVCAG